MSKTIGLETPRLSSQSVDKMMDNTSYTPSTKLFATPQIDAILDMSKSIKKNETLETWYGFWSDRIEHSTKDTFLDSIKEIINLKVRQTMYKDASYIVHHAVERLNVKKEVIKPTLVFYEYMMESIVVEEHSKLTPENLNALIGMKPFQNATLLCCFCTSLLCLSQTIPPLNSLLYVFTIQAYDLHRVTETFISLLTNFKPHTLPAELFTYFNNVMEACVEELCWTSESRVWEYLIQEKNSQSQDDKDDEKKSKSHHVPRAIEILIRHLLYLSLTRLQAIVTRLHILNDQRTILHADSWSLLRSILHGSISLLEARHLDTIILSTIYAASKARRIALSFKELLAAYQELYPQKLDQIKFHVSLRPLRTTCQNDASSVDVPDGNIIAFYNNVFMQAACSQLVTYQEELVRSTSVLDILIYIIIIIIVSQKDPVVPRGNQSSTTLVCDSPSIFKEAQGVIRSISTGRSIEGPILSPLPSLPTFVPTIIPTTSPLPAIISPSIAVSSSTTSSASIVFKQQPPKNEDSKTINTTTSVKRPAPETNQETKKSSN
ncbi:hypothetical protein WA158_004328 [Blastocystis sp. Blastoise]